ncbi:hypothetical protein Tco_1110220 [Tanacetum coccineum]|uniref:Uncharacterized protein n=1 Tax=Tanacetum coccineum TaxID=301880 RepID=A0ABQ5IKK6_9ASTR
MSIQDMELQKQQYLEEMQSISNQIQIKDYRNERIDIHYRRECEIKIDELKAKFNKMSIEINKKKELRKREQVANLSTHTPEPSRRFNFTCYDDDDDDEERTMPLSEIISQLPLSIVITTSPPVLPIEDLKDSPIMGNKELSTIPKKELDKFIKSSVEDLVPILSESEDTSRSDSECDLPSCDDFSPINIPEGKSMTFYNLLFDSNEDFTSSDDESLFDEGVLEDKVRILKKWTKLKQKRTKLNTGTDRVHKSRKFLAKVHAGDSCEVGFDPRVEMDLNKHTDKSRARI